MMKRFALPALAAALALAACAESSTTEPAEDTAGADSTTIVETTEPAPTATETVIVDDRGMTDDEDGSSVSVDGEDIDATIDEDGVNAEIDVE